MKLRFELDLSDLVTALFGAIVFLIILAVVVITLVLIIEKTFQEFGPQGLLGLAVLFLLPAYTYQFYKTLQEEKK